MKYILLVLALLSSYCTNAQTRIEGHLYDAANNLLDLPITINISCGSKVDQVKIRESATIEDGYFNIFLNNITPSCNCELIAKSADGLFYAVQTVFISEAYKAKPFPYDLKFSTAFRQNVDLKKLLIELQSQNTQLNKRISALEKQVKLSDDQKDELTDDLRSLERQKANIENALLMAEEVLARITQDYIPVEKYLEERDEIQKGISDQISTLNQRVSEIEQKYKRVIAVNTFDSDCKCIGHDDDYLKLSLLLMTNEVKDGESIIIERGNPLFKKVPVKIQLRILDDENSKGGFEIIKDENNSDFLILDTFFDENPIEITFRAMDIKVFSESILRNRSGYQVLIFTPSGTISNSFYFGNLNTLCDDPSPLSPIQLEIKP